MEVVAARKSVYGGKGGTDLTFPDGMAERKHSWMRVFIGCILIIALPFRTLPRTVVYTQNVPLTTYLHSHFLIFFAEKFQKKHCLGLW